MAKELTQSWSELAEIARQGTWTENNIEVGDYKALTLNGTVGTVALSNYSICATVIGFDHNKEREIVGYPHAITFGLFADSTGKQLALVDGSYGSLSSSATSFSMNPASSPGSSTNAGGWKNAKLRKNILGSTDVENGDATSAATTSPVANTLMSALPSDLRVVLKPITKYTDNVCNKSTAASAVTSTIDYLPLMAEFETFGTKNYANANEQTYQAQYQYYKNGKSKIRDKYSDSATAAYWWLRSPYADYSQFFCLVSTDGSSNYQSSGFSFGLAPVFNICADAKKISVDMSTLSGWANLASGSHTLTIKAKADGYTTSDASAGVTFTKASTS